MEENIQKFTERLRELVAQGKKKKSILEIQEINDFFADMELEAEQMEKVFEYLEANNIDVLRISSDDDLDVDMDVIMAEEADDVDMENIDLSVPDGVSIEDPVRMYLKEIGKVPLLSADTNSVRMLPGGFVRRSQEQSQIRQERFVFRCIWWRRSTN